MAPQSSRTPQTAAVGMTATLFLVGIVVAGSVDQKAIAIITKLGGKIVRDVDKPGQPVVKVFLSGSKVTDAHMKDVATLKQLQTLDLRGTQVADAGLRSLATLPEIRELYMFGSKATDAGLKEIAALKQLQKLYLIGAKVTDAGLKHLVGLKQLRELNVSDTGVTIAGERELQKSLPECQVVR